MSIISKLKNKLNTSLIIQVLIFLMSCATQSQTVSNEIETKLLWAERYIGHYSDNNGNMIKGIGGLIAYVKPNDTISQKNYENGYYEINKNSHRKIDTYNNLLDNVYFKNDKIYASFCNKFDDRTNNTKIIFNNIWQYELCQVTFKKYFIGVLEQYIPDFKTSKNNILKYDTIKIPTYVVEIISIEPHKKGK